MPEENQSASLTEQPSVAAAPDWSILDNLSNNQTVKIEPLVATTKEVTAQDELKKDLAEGEQPPADDIKIEIPNVEEKPKDAQAEVKQETKPEESLPTDSLFEVTDVPKVYEDGTFQALAKDLGVDLAEESFEAFKDNFVPKAELERVAKMTKENLFAEYKPEVAAALEMLELGLPQELILEPTKNIDNSMAILDNAIKLSDAELVRAVLENTEGWTPELIETELDELSTNGKLSHKAQVERLNIIADKKQLAEQRDTVLATREQLIQKHTADKQRVEQQKKEEDTTLFLKTLNDKSDFMGVPIPKQFKDSIALKFRSGLYDNELSAAQAKVNTVLFHELGSKFAKLVKDSAFAKGKESEVRKAANIPPTTAQGGGQRVINTEPTNESTSQFEILREAFGSK